MIENENARRLNSVQTVRKASTELLSLRGDKSSGKDSSQKTTSLFIDADYEQAIWEDYIRHGTPYGDPAPVIIAQEIYV